MKCPEHDDYVNGLSIMIHSDCKNVGWWDDPDRCIYTCIQLISTEIAEATEGDRKNLMDDHLLGFKMEEVELADAMIRLLDLAGKLGLSYDSGLGIVHHWCIATNPVGQQHLGINARLLKFAQSYQDFVLYTDPVEYVKEFDRQADEVGTENPIYWSILQSSYCDLVKSIIQVAMNRGYGFWEALELKVEYNRTRADHKREARAQENGKKY